MTEPSNRSAVVPFAGLPAIAPPSAADLGRAADSVVPALRRDAYESLNDAHFINAGIHHAAAVSDYYCLHDVDAVPVVANYQCPSQPLRLVNTIRGPKG